MPKDDQSPDPTRRRLLKGIAGSIANVATGKILPAASASISASLPVAAAETVVPPAIANAALAISAMPQESLFDTPRFQPILRAMSTWGNYRAMYRNMDEQVLHKLKNAVLNGNVVFTKKDIFVLAERLYGSQGAHAAFHTELLEESRALSNAAPSYETILECVRHPDLFDASPHGLTRGNPLKTAHELNAIAHMNEGQLQAAHAREIGLRVAEIDEMRALLEKLPSIKHLVMQKAGVEITDIPSFGTQYRAGENPIPVDYYTQSKPAQWRRRIAIEADTLPQTPLSGRG